MAWSARRLRVRVQWHATQSKPCSKARLAMARSRRMHGTSVLVPEFSIIMTGCESTANRTHLPANLCTFIAVARYTAASS